ncbi:hypothetical protein [Roseateles sp. BYS96W]|uniref:NERD domain-containing protein n=1 Tax=Pelomonas nitida TaxID=3299027 RepID=A0ABW7G118_9BURK
MRQLKAVVCRMLAAARSAWLPVLRQEADGVYQPLPPPGLSLALLGAAMVASVLLVLGRGGAWMSLSVAAGLALGFALRTLLAWRRHGARGRPLVRLADGVLTIRHTGQDVTVPLLPLVHLVVYGPAGHRTYRFVGADGHWQEVRPQWSAPSEAAVIASLQGALGERVIVETPQTAFEQARGDGPYFGS